MQLLLLLQTEQVQNADKLADTIAQEQELIDMVVYGSLIPLIIVFIFLFFVVYRSRRERAFRKREFELELSRSNMEMKALRSQVNPHFIFNCLASIQHFVSNNNNEEAEYYLVRFSRLIRQVLENSTQKMVSLEEDLEALEMYVEMEKLRLNNGFEFEMKIDPSLDMEETFIPPLIIQPLIENAIWHGVSDDLSKGEIDLELEPHDQDGIRCTVINNASEEKTNKKSNPNKKKSLGLSLIRERITLLNSLYNRHDELFIEDIKHPIKLYPAKKVVIVIPCEKE